MIQSLVGSQTVQNILFFLFVNEKCYGTQIHRVLGIPLTPIQKGLARLEKGGVIRSFYEGKTRVYQFNPIYPLLDELELLLKKAYTLLNVQEKKKFSFVREQRYLQTSLYKKNSEILLAFWKRLSKVKKLVFHARENRQKGWGEKGDAVVNVVEEGITIIFNERGKWKKQKTQEVEFKNTFRWTLDKENNLITLEHLRRGVEHPVFLFNLTPNQEGILSSIDTHLFEGDTCFGHAYCDSQCLRLNWKEIGPAKNFEIDYYYT